MPWLKNITDERTGTPITYWAIQSLQYNAITGITNILVGGWLNAANYLDAKQPIQSVSMEIPAGVDVALAEGVIAFGEAFARAQPLFSGSIKPPLPLPKKKS